MKNVLAYLMKSTEGSTQKGKWGQVRKKGQANDSMDDFSNNNNYNKTTPRPPPPQKKENAYLFKWCFNQFIVNFLINLIKIY